MPPKTSSEKNLWQRLPVRWRVIFTIIALIAASYGVRHYFPLTPSLRDGQKTAAVNALTVETVFETPDAAEKEIAPQNRKKITDIVKDKPRKARVSGVYVSKLVETGNKVQIAYKEFFRNPPEAGEPSATEEDSPMHKENIAFADRITQLIIRQTQSSDSSSISGNVDKIVSASRNFIEEVWKRFRTEKQAPVLLIHGVGSDGTQLEALAEELIKRGVEHVIVPDLPGAGSSQRELEDYSIEASAGMLYSLLDELGIKKVNVLGFGEGGGVAVFMAHQQPARLKSIALASSVGAQEFELLGNHIVNKIVYTFHLGFFKFAQDVLPHFGLMDYGNVNKAYARVLWDSDISELKKYLREWNGPTYIAHGKDDLISPFASAQYSAALAPQAQTYFCDGGHDALLDDPKTFADNYAAFLVRLATPSEVEALSRPPQSIPANADGNYSYPPIEPAGGARVIVLMLIILVCTFVAEDPTCLAAGLLVAQGLIGFIPACLACLVGIFIGDLVLYLIGRFLGRPILRKPPLKWLVSEQQIDEMSERFSKNPKGLALIVSSRFIPGSRVPTFVAAGIMKLDWHKLIFLFFIAAALWTPPLILLAEYVGASVIEQFKEWHHNAAWVVIVAIVALYLISHYIIPAFTWRGRRRHVMTRRQITRHEFWPNFILHTPVILQFIWLGIIYRSFTIFTLANRAFGPTGGMAAGSKFETYKKFVGNSAAGVKTVRIPAEKDLNTRWENALKILKNEKIAFPCVIKPEIGDGGIGVYIAQSSAHLRAWLDANVDDAVAQEFVGGNEYEVIWSRRPGRKDGRIRSVIQKDFVCVKGDGERKLEDLIWADDHGVCNGKLFSKQNFRKADMVLKPGKYYPLAPTGSRIRGARFIARPELRTGTISKAIDALADACGDVHYICLDIRAASDEALSNGEAIRITSVKGAGTIASSLYDGYVRMGSAYTQTYKQLDFCFSVGAELRDELHLRPEISIWRLFELWGTARGRSDNYVKEPTDSGS